MYPYVACFCGRPLGHLYNAFILMCAKHRATHGPLAPIGPVLDQLRITKLCCRARMMNQTEFKYYYNATRAPSFAPTVTIEPPQTEHP